MHLNNNKTHTIYNILHSKQISYLDAKVIIKHVLSYSDAQIIINDQQILNSIDYNKIQTLIEQRILGTPIAYITSYKEFYSRNFIVSTDTLIPRPETEFLVDFIITNTNHKNQKPLNILDLATGSGCIAITSKLELKDLVNVYATDISDAALNIAKQNAKQLNADVQFFLSNWYNNVPPLKFDIIVSNPPYIAINDQHLNNLQHEPQIALTDFADGLTCIKHIISGAKNYLATNGIIAIEHGASQKDSVNELFMIYNFHNIHTIKDYANLDRITYAHKLN